MTYSYFCCLSILLTLSFPQNHKAAAEEEAVDRNKMTSASTVARLVIGPTNADREDAVAEEVAQETEEAVHRKY